MKKYFNALRTIFSIFILTYIAGCSTTHTITGEKLSTVASFDGSLITYGVRGKGETTVVFIHCWTCNHEFWRPQIEYFSKDNRVVWVDLSGHGLSGSNRKDYTMEAFGKDIAAVVNKINAEQIILVGHSMGGPVAIEAANILGPKVIGIVGVDTFYTPFELPKSEQAIREFVEPFKSDYKHALEQMIRSMFKPTADQDLVTTIINQMSIPSQEMGVSAMHEILRWNAVNGDTTLTSYSNKLRNINAAPTGDTEALHSSVTTMSDVGHFLPQVKPVEFNQTLNNIMQEF